MAAPANSIMKAAIMILLNIRTIPVKVNYLMIPVLLIFPLDQYAFQEKAKLWWQWT